MPRQSDEIGKLKSEQREAVVANLKFTLPISIILAIAVLFIFNPHGPFNILLFVGFALVIFALSSLMVSSRVRRRYAMEKLKQYPPAAVHRARATMLKAYVLSLVWTAILVYMVPWLYTGQNSISQPVNLVAIAILVFFYSVAFGLGTNSLLSGFGMLLVRQRLGAAKIALFSTLGFGIISLFGLQLIFTSGVAGYLAAAEQLSAMVYGSWILILIATIFLRNSRQDGAKSQKTR